MDQKFPAKPFLKWAGGKGQLLSTLDQLFPHELKEGRIEFYYEPFLGSGALFFHIAQKYSLKSAFLYDINPDLILTYSMIQQHSENLMVELRNIQKKYLQLSEEKRLRFFYEQRELFNKGLKISSHPKSLAARIQRAVQFIFLNKTCYNGLYRVNAKGKFNVPAGRYANPKICDEANIIAVSRILGIAEIRNKNFNAMLADWKPSSFVYFDPPYRPISKTSHFKSYNKEDFDDSRQIALSELFRRLDKKGSKVMISNSDPENNDSTDQFFMNLYNGFPIVKVRAKRQINSVASKRGLINEIVVCNYSIPKASRRDNSPKK